MVDVEGDPMTQEVALAARLAGLEALATDRVETLPQRGVVRTDRPVRLEHLVEVVAGFVALEHGFRAR